MTQDAGNQKTEVFIIDDHPLVREWLTNLISQQPDLAVCGEVATAAAARQALTRSKPEVAIVDIALRDSSGIELIKDLRQTCPELRVLVLSTYDERLYAERALRAGARGYVMKRESTSTVVKALRRVLQGKFYVSEDVSELITSQFIGGKTLASLSPIEQFSDRELAVFKLMGEGRGTRQIAETLSVSIKTVQAYYGRMKEKLNLRNSVDLQVEAMRHHNENDLK